jgi:hypothetical protein
VLARVLDGNDYILEVSDQSVILVVLGVSAPATRIGSNPVVSAAPTEPTLHSAIAPDRTTSPGACQPPPPARFRHYRTSCPTTRSGLPAGSVFSANFRPGVLPTAAGRCKLLLYPGATPPAIGPTIHSRNKH